MDPRRLTLLRHGHAQPQDGATPDFARPLTARGRAQAREMGELLVRRGAVPELILASPAERTRATALIVAQGCALDPERIRYPAELYNASAGTIWSVAAACDASLRSVLVCGHNPGLSQLAGRFGPTPQRRDLPTAGLVTAIWMNRRDAEAPLPENADDCVQEAPTA